MKLETNNQLEPNEGIFEKTSNRKVEDSLDVKTLDLTIPARAEFSEEEDDE